MSGVRNLLSMGGMLISAMLLAQPGWAQEESNGAANQEAHAVYEYALSPIQNDVYQQEVKVVFDQKVIPEFNYPSLPPQLLSIRLYSNDGVLLQEISPENFNSNARPVWPELEDVNFDGYADLSLVVSSGSLGDFYAYWLYNPETGLFEEAVFDDGEPVNSFADAEHKQMISSVTARRAYETNVVISRWSGLHLVEKESGNGYILPVQVDGQMNYCEVVVTYNEEQGQIDYSVKAEQSPGGRIQLHGELPLEPDENRYELCFDEEEMDMVPMAAIGVMLWQKEGAAFVQKEAPLTVQWVQSKDAQGQLMEEWCPVVPYVDLDKRVVSTKVLDDSPNSDFSVCQSTNPGLPLR